MLLLHPTLLLPVLIGCSLASFISPHYVSSYDNGYYPVGPNTEPEGSGTNSGGNIDETVIRGIVGAGQYGGYAISPPAGYKIKFYKKTENGKILVTNCNVCRLCCIGHNISFVVEDNNRGPNLPGPETQTPAPGSPSSSETPTGLTNQPSLPQTTMNPNGIDDEPGKWSYPLPPQEGYRVAPYPPNQPGGQRNPSPSAPGPNRANPETNPENPRPTPTIQGFPDYRNYYPLAPGQYATPPPVTNLPCVPVATTTTTTTTTTTQAPTTTTTTTPAPCTYTPPTTTTPTPTESTQTIETTTAGNGGEVVIPGDNRACCTIDLRSLQAIVSCGVAVGSEQRCCTQSCSPGSIRQRPIQINPQFFTRYFQQLQSTRITCEQAVNIGLIKSTDIEGFCNQYVPWPTTNPTRPSGEETAGVSPTWPTGAPGTYVIPPTQGSANLSVITSIVTIVIATVLCF